MLKPIVHRLMTMSTSILEQAPLVVVLGATGVGKSKLAVQLAKEFDGEVINADAMQMYQGLDITTNKMLAEEQEGIPHHLLSILSATDKITVKDFQRMCLKTINGIQRQGKLPILVGGTFYYVESVLWKVLLANEGLNFDDTRSVEMHESTASDARAEDVARRLAGMSTAQQYAMLKTVDPDRAETLHPGHRRSIHRSLQVYLLSGVPYSVHLQRQRSADDSNSRFGGGLRFERVCLLWLTCDKCVLDERLDKRVDNMLDRGLLEELRKFHSESKWLISQRPADSSDKQVDYESGLLQSIGVRHFSQYLAEPCQSEAALAAAIDWMKTDTRGYVRAQLKWIRQRFLSKARGAPPIYRLDSSDLPAWHDTVWQPARSIVASWLSGVEPSQSPEPQIAAPANDAVVRFCEVCNLHLCGLRQFDEHMKSRRHKKSMQHKKTLENLRNAPWLL